MKTPKVPFAPLYFKNETLYLLDQRKLPTREVWVPCRTSVAVWRAIRTMVVRGAPAIGVTAGYGLYLGVRKFRGTPAGFQKKLFAEARYLDSSRPTARNLAYALERILNKVSLHQAKHVEHLKKMILEEAVRIHLDDVLICRRIGRFGAGLFKRGSRILTHCNAGGLATSGYGTALAVFYALKEKRIPFSVYVDETRPLLQGARLTAWELMKSKIPCTLICDNMAASLMRAGKIDGVVVGADRIAMNGDTANKIGTYGVAVLAHHHGIPLYIAAPSTTFDLKAKTGKDIPIEERPSHEISHVQGKQLAPTNMKTFNPSFDVTPHALIRGIVTEAGVLKAPFNRSIRKVAVLLKGK
ncbi:MAG TPA: S-methyl-5-thioribose-1-phosphate isomerase [Candidatus Omnitrophota bacterium]|nr:S-methyl-5-thioribose-1-phosphate isomerase [Candidatus Omnitrophota bacterium]HPS37532.1 S-methyl-5-thioribose-1-phosphate isomerase [Candidatus Omnitrophota bacterium]